MSINIDEIIAGSNSTDDLLQALSLKSQESQADSAALVKLASAAEGIVKPSSWLDKLKSVVTPKSVAGQLDTKSLYNKYYTDQIDKGIEPVSIEDFTKAIEERTKPKASSR